MRRSYPPRPSPLSFSDDKFAKDENVDAASVEDPHRIPGRAYDGLTEAVEGCVDEKWNLRRVLERLQEFDKTIWRLSSDGVHSDGRLRPRENMSK